MDERTVKVSLGETELEIYSGNMSLMRFRKAGGSMDELDLIDEENLPTDLMVDAVGAAVLFVQANQVGVGDSRLSYEQIANLSAKFEEPAFAARAALQEIPWLANAVGLPPGEAIEEGATASSKSGPSPSSSSDGMPTSTGKSAVGSG